MQQSLTSVVGFPQPKDEYGEPLVRYSNDDFPVAVSTFSQLREMILENPSLVIGLLTEASELPRLLAQRLGLSLVYISDQTEEICKLAVQQNGLALQFVKEQTEEICRLAVENNKAARGYIRSGAKKIKNPHNPLHGLSYEEI